jgi:hypothetical protein
VIQTQAQEAKSHPLNQEYGVDLHYPSGDANTPSSANPFSFSQFGFDFYRNTEQGMVNCGINMRQENILKSHRFPQQGQDQSTYVTGGF